jgi:uncharacterized protein YycO
MLESVKEFFKKIKIAFLRWGADILVFKGPMWLVFFDDIHYKIKGDDQRKILSTLKPGDILLRRYNHYLGSLLIPGYWSHAAIYVGEDSVIHMLGQGCTKEDILTFLRTDDLAIIRFNDETLATSAINKAIEFYNKKIPYDYEFDSQDLEELYCSKLTYLCYNKPKINQKTVTGNILPDDMLHMEGSKVINWRLLK